MKIQGFQGFRVVGVAIIVYLGCIATSVYGQTLLTVSPPSQRVHEYIELHGSGFGTSQGSSLVRFTDGVEIWDAGKAYVWRDSFIRIRVPVGKLSGATIVPIAKSPLLVYVQTSAGQSESLTFQVIAANTGTLEFRQLTAIASDHADTSTVLGSPNMNSARTKDAEIGDVNGDEWPDLLDNNSQNILNSSHSVLRLNNQDKTFTSNKWEPLSDGESGAFAVSIPAGGDFFEDQTSYDADFADINNDRFPDLIHTAARDGDPPRVRLLMNNAGGVPGKFTEESAARLPADAMGLIGCPDDLDHADINNDGNIDFMVTLRTSVGNCGDAGDTSETRIFVNDKDSPGNFLSPIILNAPANISTHDAFFIDANYDGFQDVVLVNEWPLASAQAQLFLNNGNTASPNFALADSFDTDASAGDKADFNGDGYPDFVLGHSEATVYMNDPNSPGNFTPTVLVPATVSSFFYDFEMGDLNLDGWVDIVGVTLAVSRDSVKIWLNNHDGTFNEITSASTTDVLPGHGVYQRLSADLIDFDLDGDLDLYVTGNDGQDSVNPGNGRGPNQFFENLLIGLDIVSPRQAAPAYAGSSTGGRKVLIRLRPNLPVSGLAASDFVITVVGAPPDSDVTVTGAQIEEEYWLLVQMPAMPDGCYPLEIFLASDPALKDVELDSLCYKEERLFDRALAIDRTTSMLFDMTTITPDTEKMDSARAAANFFVNLSEDNDKIGVTSFKRDADDGDDVVAQEEMAQTDFAMKTAFDTSTSTDNRDLAIDVIDVLQPDGVYFKYQTAIGAGLREAWNELQGEGDASHEWEIVLLTDGQENLPPFWAKVSSGTPEVLPLRPEIVGADPHVTIHTVAVGPAADAPLLIEIADATGGQFFNLYEGTASFGLISRLASVYKYIDEEMRDEQRFFYRESVPDPVKYSDSPLADVQDTHGRKFIRIDSFVVPTGFESMSVGFHWNQSHAIESVVLYDPTLAVVSSAPPVRTIRSDPKHKIYRIRDPQPGRYYYTVELGTTDPFEFFVVASGITDLIAQGRAGEVRETSPGHFEIPLRIVSGDFEPVLFASVTGDVILPDKSRVAITLHDDGIHADGRQRDGIYGQTFAHTMPGAYTAELVITGLSNRNEPFTRYTIMSFAFPGVIPNPEEPEQPTGKGISCPPCWFLWSILILFALLLLWLLWQWYRCCYRRVAVETTVTQHRTGGGQG